jgi:hypothetical protein
LVDRFSPGFSLVDETGAMISIKGDPVAAQPALTVLQALAAEHGSDAHFVGYGVLTGTGALETQVPRLTKGVLGLLVKLGIVASTTQVVGTAVAIDFDLPEHAKWTAATLAQAGPIFQQASDRWPLLKSPTCWYTTSGGCRFVWVLSRPIPVEGAGGLQDRLAGTIAQCYRAGLAVDTQCQDWTRLFRLPRVQRADKDASESRTQEQSYFRMSWGRIDSNAKELTPNKELVLHDPEQFKSLSGMSMSDFDGNEHAKKLGKLWERRIGKPPVQYDHRMIPEALGEAPSAGEVSRLWQDTSGKPGESAVIRMIVHLIEASAYPRSSKRNPFPPAVEAHDHLTGKKSLYQDPQQLSGLHGGILGLARTICLTLRERLGEAPGRIGPRLIHVVVLKVAERANQERVVAGRSDARDSNQLAQEVWNAVCHVYRLLRFQSLGEETDAAEAEAVKSVQLSEFRALTDAMERAVKKQLLQWGINSIPGETERHANRQALTDAGLEDQSSVSVIERWIEDWWKQILILDLPKEGRAVLTVSPTGDVSYGTVCYSDGAVLSEIKQCGHDLVPLIDMSNPVKPQRKPMADLIGECGMQADLCLSRIADRSKARMRVSSDQRVSITLVSKIMGMRSDVRPVHSPLVEGWLHCLAGEHIEKLLDWLAAFTCLEKPIAGLYLEGRPDAGKGMLGQALKHLTESQTFAPFNQVIEQFQDTMRLTPFIWGDEETTSASLNPKSVMNMYKKLVTGEIGPLNAKGKSMTEVEGYWRVLLTANGPNLLNFNEDVNENDKGALVQRTMHIQARDESVHFLKNLGGRAGTASWPERDIPQHIMWLRQDRLAKIVPGSRLFVEGIQTEWHDRLLINTGGSDTVVRALGRILREHARYPETVLVKGAEVLINTPNLHRVMEVFYHQKSTRVPSNKSVNLSIVNLSLSKSAKLYPSSVGGVKGSVEMWPLNMRAVYRALRILGENFYLLPGPIWDSFAPEDMRAEVERASEAHESEAREAKKRTTAPIPFMEVFSQQPPRMPLPAPPQPPNFQH